MNWLVHTFGNHEGISKVWQKTRLCQLALPVGLLARPLPTIIALIEPETNISFTKESNTPICWHEFQMFMFEYNDRIL